MIYYDRRLPADLLNLLRPSQPLGWLVPFLGLEEFDNVLPHIQFRCTPRGDRRHGGIQVYFGRTSPLEVRGAAKGFVRFQAYRRYEKLAPGIFGAAVRAEKLDQVKDRLKEHLKESAKSVNPMFVGGEAVPQAGMLRRYGPGYRSGDPFVAVDSEVRAGFGSKEEQKRFEVDQRKQLGIAGREQLPKKLDVLGLMPDGNLCVIELKAEGEGMHRAAVQAAAHVLVFRELVARNEAGPLNAVIGGMLSQKAAAGLLGIASLPNVRLSPRVIPVIAAPDSRPGWRDEWLREISSVQKALGDQLEDLRLWLLDGHGEVSEVALP